MLQEVHASKIYFQVYVQDRTRSTEMMYLQGCARSTEMM